MARNRKLVLGLNLSGAGVNVSAWRHSQTPSDANVNLQHFAEMAQTAERGKFDFAFLTDSGFITHESSPRFISRFEPTTVLSALSVLTKRIGLVATATTSFSEPYTLARTFASLDRVSGGRAGWNAVTAALDGLGKNHGHAKLMEHSLRYRIAGEYVQVVKGLWDSWEDDALVRDKESGVYFDPKKLHTLDHQGEFFSVLGPLNIERSRQGRPVVFQAGGSDAGRDFGAREADAIYTNLIEEEEAGEFYQDVKARAVRFGRSADEVLILPSISVVTGATEEEAKRKYEQYLAYDDIDAALNYLGRYFGHYDFRQFSLDEPFPDLGDLGKDNYRSATDRIKKMAAEEGLTLRQVALRVAAPKGAFIGTPVQVADKIQQAFEAHLADGFVVRGFVEPEGIREFVDGVVPILQQRGLFRTEYEHDTLRGNLGLPYPENRYAGRHSAAQG